MHGEWFCPDADEFDSGENDEQEACIEVLSDHEGRDDDEEELSGPNTGDELHISDSEYDRSDLEDAGGIGIEAAHILDWNYCMLAASTHCILVDMKSGYSNTSQYIPIVSERH